MVATLILTIVLVFFILAAIYFWWQYFRLCSRLSNYSKTLHSIAEGKEPYSGLPLNVTQLEELTYSVNNLFSTLNNQLSIVNVDRAKLAAVLDQMTDGVLIADIKGRIQFINPAAERLFETKNSLQRTVAEVIRHYRLVESWQQSRKTREPQEESIEIPNQHLFLRLLVLPDKNTGDSLLLVQDLTRVRHLETVRQDFVSNISHELRTPLASLKALAETLSDGALEDPPAARRFLSQIETEVDALNQMATELLELSRIESEQVPLDLKKISPDKLLNSAAERMRAQAERAGLSLRLECIKKLPKVNADMLRLEQVLVNLIHNAIKFTYPGGEVILSADLEGRFIRFTVQDTGIGIPEADLPRIFERFYKADRARTHGGTGLGLSIAQHIIKAHNGRIWAESLEKHGSKFHFTIPINP